MIGDKILPYNWVYDNVFNFSDKEKLILKSNHWGPKTEIQTLTDWNEGNDPMETGEQLEHQVIWPWDRTRWRTNTTGHHGSIFIVLWRKTRWEDEQGGRPKEMNKPFKDSGRIRDPLGNKQKRRPLD